MPKTPSTATPRVQLRSNLAIDLTVTGALSASLITWAFAIKPALPVPSCTICDESNGRVNPVDDAFRKTFKLRSGSTIGIVSDAFGYGVAPVGGVVLAFAAAGHDRRVDEAPENVLFITETSLIFTVLQQGLTELLPRERPTVHAAPSAARERLLRSHSSLESFPGGHNGLGFAVAAAGGTIATMRGYRLAPLVWIVGGAVALATSYMRMAADRHYFSDLTAGAALGIGTGIAVPLLLHRPLSEQSTLARRWLGGAMVSSTGVPGGRVIDVGWVF